MGAIYKNGVLYTESLQVDQSLDEKSNNPVSNKAVAVSVNLKQDKISGGITGQVWTSNGDLDPSWQDAKGGVTFPVGMVIELDSTLDPNNLFDGTWEEV